ncbi:hypothetical protein VNI00_008055 [Paramarasmius palmivorus]|uniref:Fork-head domain-containing protein n=1 Tax=Paramarasmius palmivorus TaxID=297713 RepID=A0AAW0CYK7_9AGAR
MRLISPVGASDENLPSPQINLRSAMKPKIGMKLTPHGFLRQTTTLKIGLLAIWLVLRFIPSSTADKQAEAITTLRHYTSHEAKALCRVHLLPLGITMLPLVIMLPHTKPRMVPNIKQPTSATTVRAAPRGPPSGTHHGASYNFSPTMHHGTSSMQNPHSEPPITAAEAENYLRRAHNLPSHLPVHLNSLPDSPPGIRPPQTLPCLMQLAIWSSPNKKLSRTEICDAIAERFDYYRDEPTGAWRNTIRHTLSLKNAFKLCDRVPGQSGRGSTWEIDFANMEGNKRERKRGTRGSRTTSTEEDEYKYEPSPSPPLGSSSAAGSVDRRVRTRYSQSSASHPSLTARRPSPSHSSQSSPAQFYSASDPGSFHGHYVDHSVRLSAYHQQPTFGHSSFQHSEYTPYSQSMPALPVPGHVAMPPQFMSPDTTMHMMGPPASSFSFNTGGLNQDQQEQGGGY